MSQKNLHNPIAPVAPTAGISAPGVRTPPTFLEVVHQKKWEWLIGILISLMLAALTAVKISCDEESAYAYVLNAGGQPAVGVLVVNHENGEARTDQFGRFRPIKAWRRTSHEIEVTIYTAEGRRLGTYYLRQIPGERGWLTIRLTAEPDSANSATRRATTTPIPVAAGVGRVIDAAVE